MSVTKDPLPQVSAQAPGLRAGSLGLGAVFMQAIGHMAPAMGTVTSLAFVGSLAGLVAPIAFVIAGLVCLLVAISLTQLANKISGAGGFFTYINHAFGARAAFVTAWAYFLYDPLVTGSLFAFTGSLVHDTMEQRYGWAPPWWTLFLLGAATVSVLSWFAVAISARVLLIFVAVESIVFAALAVTGLFNPGPGGFTLAPFDPGNASTNGLYLAVVFTILAYTGFESVAPLAEESRNPRRNLPIAIVGSVCIAIVYYALESWGLVVGWGTNNLPAFVSSPAPIFDLAHRQWGGAWIIVLLATVSSTLALCTATHSAATRVFFSMGRAGALPAWLARVHPKHGTPTNAIILQTGITLTGGIGISIAIGPQENFFLVGLMLTLSLILVYGIANLAVFRLYRTVYRTDFNIGLHAIVPVLGTVALVWVGYKSVADLHITDPQTYLDWAPIIVAGWLVTGLALLVVFHLVGHDGWLAKTTEGLEEDLEVDDVRVPIGVE